MAVGLMTTTRSVKLHSNALTYVTLLPKMVWSINWYHSLRFAFEKEGGTVSINKKTNNHGLTSKQHLLSK